MLKIDNLSKSYGDVKALRDVSLELGTGLFGLLGPNGAGKTTLMKTVSTLLTPDSGKLSYLGADIVQDPKFMRNRLGYLPQSFGVYPKTSALKLLNLIGALKGLHDPQTRSAQIVTLLKAVNLWEKRDVAVATYSGGMLRRFGIAQALLGDPKIIIVDEPTAGLDPLERQKFLDILSIASVDKTIILSTHIVEDVEDLCTDMAIMNSGEIITRGAPASLIKTLNGKVWQKFTTAESAEQLAENYQVLSTRAIKGEVRVHVYSLDCPESGFESVRPDLHDAYFAHLYGFVGA